MTHSPPRSVGPKKHVGVKIIGSALIVFGSFFTTLYVMDHGIGNFSSKQTEPTAQFVYDARNQSTLKPPFNIPNAAIDQSFAFRIRLVPAGQQVDYAAPLSSHTADNRGFAILHMPNVRDGYIVVVGNGKAFWYSDPFVVADGQESELIVSYKDGHLRVLVNQAIVIEKTGLGPIAPAAVPVTIGDWHLGGRKFSGEIREVNFFSEALSGT